MESESRKPTTPSTMMLQGDRRLFTFRIDVVRAVLVSIELVQLFGPLSSLFCDVRPVFIVINQLSLRQ